ncbi:MAG: hypothetical protein L0Z55_09670 [Planctomycetes bacterium]|nr:hypothetical protein [Planctomycetota bacterium]
MTELPIQGFLIETIAVLDLLGVPYAIMGGFAVRTWGIPRPTYDADVGIATDDDGLQRVLRELEKRGFMVPEEHHKGFVDVVGGFQKVKVTRFEGQSVWEVDLFLLRGCFLESALARRKHLHIGGRPAWVVAPEDLILLKLIAHRRKDQLDVEEILKIARDLDLPYLRIWAERLGVALRLDEFLNSA